MFAELKLDKGITLEDLREFVNNKLSSLPGDTPVCVSNTFLDIDPLKCTLICADEISVVFYKD
jgi:hypothetical protein